MSEVTIDLRMPSEAAIAGITAAMKSQRKSAEEPHRLIIDISCDNEDPTALTQEDFTALEQLMNAVASFLTPENEKSRPQIIFKASHRELAQDNLTTLLSTVLGKCDGVDFSDNDLGIAGVSAVIDAVIANHKERHGAQEDRQEANLVDDTVIELPLKLLALNNTGLTKGVELEALAKVAQLGELEELYLSHNNFSGVEFNGNPVNPDLLRASALGRAVWDFLDDGVQYVQVPGKEGSRLAVLDLSECGLSKPMHNHIAAVYEAVIRGKKGKRKGEGGYDHASLTLHLHDTRVKYKTSERRALQLRFIPRDRDTPTGKNGQGAITICNNQGEVVALEKPSRFRRASNAMLQSKSTDYDDPDIKNTVEATPAVADTPVAKAEDVLWRQRVSQNVEIAELIQAVVDRLTPYCADTQVSDPPEWVNLARQVRVAVQSVVGFQGDREAAILEIVGPLIDVIKQLSCNDRDGDLTRKSMSNEGKSLYDELCYIAELTLAIGGFDPKQPYTFTRRMLGLVGAAQSVFENYTYTKTMYTLRPLGAMRAFTENLVHKTDKVGALRWLSLNTQYLAENRTLLAAHYLRQGAVSLMLEALDIIPAQSMQELCSLQYAIIDDYRKAARSYARRGNSQKNSLTPADVLAAAKIRMGGEPSELESQVLLLLVSERHGSRAAGAETWIAKARQIEGCLEEGSAERELLGEVIRVADNPSFDTKNAKRLIDELRADCTRLRAEVEALANYAYGQEMVKNAERIAAEYGKFAVAFVKPPCWAVYDERVSLGVEPGVTPPARQGRQRKHSVGAGSAGNLYDKRVERVKGEYQYHILGKTAAMTPDTQLAPIPPGSAALVGGSSAGGPLGGNTEANVPVENVQGDAVRGAPGATLTTADQ